MIKLTGLYKKFNKQEVLRSLDLTINTGETMVIIGRSGCGKSVTLKHIIGLLKPDQGIVEVDDVNIATLPPLELQGLQKKFGFLFQGAALFDSMTVADNISFGLRTQHLLSAEKQIRERVAECLRLVGLEGIENSMPADLSGGMRKRVGLARAIAAQPQYILYDEPTTGVDPIMSDAVNDLIVNMKEKLGVTSIVVTHDMVSAYTVADRIAMMYHGVIQQVGTPDEIKQAPDPIVQQFITGSAKGPITLEDRG
ncbi:MAG: ABC transporter ATP-binding protein [Elusimicrobia bacterium]|nr:ABC transporter ATP-binding protein [Elusimicrobiota bacterium]